MAKNSPAKIRANNRYTSKAYDRINLTVPKGRKATIEALAAERDESVTGFINGLLRAAAGLTDAEWKEGAKDDA